MSIQFLPLFSTQFLSRIFAIGAGLSILGLTSTALALETIMLRYNNDSVSVTLDEIKDFAQGSNIEALTTLLEQENDRVQNLSGDAVELLRNALTKEISITSGLRQRVETSLASSRGEFILVKLDEVLGGMNPGTQESLESLKTALIESLADNSISVLELIERYPETSMMIDASGLTRTVNDVVVFVEWVEPTLQVVKTVVQDLVCECNTAEAVPNNPSAEAFAKDTSSVNCANTHLITKKLKPAGVEPDAIADVEMSPAQ